MSDSGTDEMAKRAHATVPRVRLALIGTAALNEPGRSLAQTRAAVADVEQMRDRGDYDQLGATLPGLAADLAALVGAGQREAWPLAGALGGGPVGRQGQRARWRRWQIMVSRSRRNHASRSRCMVRRR